MTEIFDIAGYTRISFEDDEEKEKDNTSIENQKAIIEDFVRRKFPGSRLTFYETATAAVIPLSPVRTISECARQ